MSKMTEEEHRQLHKELHKSLDELTADYINHTKCSLRATTLIDFMHWSYQQTINPDKDDYD